MWLSRRAEVDLSLFARSAFQAAKGWRGGLPEPCHEQPPHAPVADVVAFELLAQILIA